jgi:predicted PurR-regulated permease PerM
MGAMATTPTAGVAAPEAAGRREATPPSPEVSPGPARAPAAEGAENQPGQPAAPGRDPARAFWRWGKAAAVLLTLFLAWQLLLVAQTVLGALVAIILTTLIGALVALLCAPLAAVLADRARLPRSLAALLSLLALVAVLGLLIFLIAGPLITEGKALVADLPKLQSQVNAIQSWLTQHGINVARVDLVQVAHSLVPSSPQALGNLLLGAVTGAFSLLVNLVIVLVAAFWLLRDHERLRHLVVDNLPASWRPHVDFTFSAFVVVVGGYIRAQVSVALMVGVLSGMGCWVIGVPFPIVVGVGAGVFELIPLVGPWVGFGLASFLALTVSPFLVVEVAVLFLIIQALEGYIVAPRVQGRFVRLHPLIAFLALFAGIEVAGFAGAFLAIPLVSLAAVLLRWVLVGWRAEHPEVFDPSSSEARLAGRRRRLLLDYRIFGSGRVRRIMDWVVRRED